MLTLVIVHACTQNLIARNMQEIIRSWNNCNQRFVSLLRLFVSAFYVTQRVDSSDHCYLTN